MYQGELAISNLLSQSVVTAMDVLKAVSRNLIYVTIYSV